MNRALNVTMCNAIEGPDGLASYKNTYSKITGLYKDGRVLLHAFCIYYHKIYTARAGGLSAYHQENATLVDLVCQAFIDDGPAIIELGQVKRDMFISVIEATPNAIQK